MNAVTLILSSPLPGLRNPPRPLLVPGPSGTGSSDSDGGLFAVPTTLPPNSRHGKLFSPSKEAELTFRQHLSSISVSVWGGPPMCERPRGVESAPSHAGRCSLTDAVGFLPAKAPEAAEPAPAEATGSPGQGLVKSEHVALWLGQPGHRASSFSRVFMV